MVIIEFFNLVINFNLIKFLSVCCKSQKRIEVKVLPQKSQLIVPKEHVAHRLKNQKNLLNQETF